MALCPKSGQVGQVCKARLGVYTSADASSMRPRVQAQRNSARVLRSRGGRYRAIDTSQLRRAQTIIRRQLAPVIAHLHVAVHSNYSKRGYVSRGKVIFES